MSLSLSLMITKRLSECWEAAKSCCALRLLFLLHRLNSALLPSLLSSPLRSSFPPCLISPSFFFSCRRSSADNTGGGSGGPSLPGNFLTNHTAAFTCCILVQLAPLCVHCGETAPLFGDSEADVYTGRHHSSSVRNRVSVCMSAS